jgi:hypothetical protein
MLPQMLSTLITTLCIIRPVLRTLITMQMPTMMNLIRHHMMATVVYIPAQTG